MIEEHCSHHHQKETEGKIPTFQVHVRGNNQEQRIIEPKLVLVYEGEEQWLLEELKDGKKVLCEVDLTSDFKISHIKSYDHNGIVCADGYHLKEKENVVVIHATCSSETLNDIKIKLYEGGSDWRGERAEEDLMSISELWEEFQERQSRLGILLQEAELRDWISFNSASVTTTSNTHFKHKTSKMSSDRLRRRIESPPRLHTESVAKDILDIKKLASSPIYSVRRNSSPNVSSPLRCLPYNGSSTSPLPYPLPNCRTDQKQKNAIFLSPFKCSKPTNFDELFSKESNNFPPVAQYLEQEQTSKDYYETELTNAMNSLKNTLSKFALNAQDLSDQSLTTITKSSNGHTTMPSRDPQTQDSFKSKKRLIYE
jgi:hypothetical protein